MRIAANRTTRYLATALAITWLLPATAFADGPVGEWYMSFVRVGQDDQGPSTPYLWRGPFTLAIVEEDGKYSGTFLSDYKGVDLSDIRYEDGKLSLTMKILNNDNLFSFEATIDGDSLEGKLIVPDGEWELLATGTRLTPEVRETLGRLRGAWLGDLGDTGKRIVIRFEQGADGRDAIWMDYLDDERSRNMPVTAMQLNGDAVQLEFATARSNVSMPLSAVAEELEFAWGASFEGRLDAAAGRLEGGLTRQIFVRDSSRRLLSRARFTLAMEPAGPEALSYRMPRQDESGQRVLRYTYAPPPDTGDGWETGRIDAEAHQGLAGPMEGILDESYPGIESVLVIKDGRLVVEEYFYGFDRNRLHVLQSVNKSIHSVVTGVAIQRGFLEGVQTPVASFFPEMAAEQNWDARKRRMTLEHLLTMTSGLPQESIDDRAIRLSEDKLRHVAARPMIHEPGQEFDYNSSSLYLLAGALGEASGMTARELAERYLFGPLGIEDFVWQGGGLPAGTVAMPFTMLRPRDLAKIGQLMLNGGTWKGQRIVSETWVEQSIRRRPTDWGPDVWYGYLWWSRDIQTRSNTSIPVFYAQGLGDQFMIVVPDLEMIVVIMSHNYTRWTGGSRGPQIMPELIDLFADVESPN